jgi:hypothetical protein
MDDNVRNPKVKTEAEHQVVKLLKWLGILNIYTNLRRLFYPYW